MAELPPQKIGWKIRVKRVQIEVEVVGEDLEKVKQTFYELAKKYLG